jgi:hypothetical protein
MFTLWLLLFEIISTLIINNFELQVFCIEFNFSTSSKFV